MERKDSSKVVVIVGGPGGSGSTVISKKLSEIYNLRYVYGGEIFRGVVKERFEDDFDSVFDSAHYADLVKVDKYVDDLLRKEAKKGSVLIESKVFAALAKKEGLNSSVTIWLDASLHVRVLRHINKGVYKNIFQKIYKYFVERKRLRERWSSDSKRYSALYEIDYSKPDLYYDIVVDSTHLGVEDTVNLILKKIEDGQYLKKQ